MKEIRNVLKAQQTWIDSVMKAGQDGDRLTDALINVLVKKKLITYEEVEEEYNKLKNEDE